MFKINKVNQEGAICSEFSKVYPMINELMFEEAPEVKSRNGNTKELLSFVTKIKNPYCFMVGGWDRNINPFFLMAEALWIFTGQKDVKFLSWFNSNMKQFSDDGINFHAPYGHRLRCWGIPTEKDMSKDDEALHDVGYGLDQIEVAIKMFDEDAHTRRVVLSIWNPELDLNFKSKDLPCNDTLALKIREDKLYLSIFNRSNDLHWGLPTNVFQFGFLGNALSEILGVGYAQQNHFSDSLHIYLSNSIGMNMYANYKNTRYIEQGDLYDHCHALRMDFKKFQFKKTALDRLKTVDDVFHLIIKGVKEYHQKIDFSIDDLYDKELAADIFENHSKYFGYVYKMLCLYLYWKKIGKGVHRNEGYSKIIDELSLIRQETAKLTRLNSNWDFVMLCENFLSNLMSSASEIDKRNGL